MGGAAFPPPLPILAVLLRVVLRSLLLLFGAVVLLLGGVAFCSLLLSGAAGFPPFGEPPFLHLIWIVLLSPLLLVGDAAFPSFCGVVRPSSLEPERVVVNLF